MTPAEHYAEAERLITPGRVVGPTLVALAQVHAILALYSPPAEVTMVRNEPRVWPQDHADDVTVVGDVLTDEPGPEITEVIDNDGDTWRRLGAGLWWECVTCTAEPMAWDRLTLYYGPLRGVS